MKRFFIGLLKTVTMIGAATLPAVINGVAPGTGILIQTVLNAVLTAESQIGAGNGPQKLSASLSMVQVSAPAIVGIIEQATGKELADEALFAEGITDLVNALVKILNAFRVLPKAA